MHAFSKSMKLPPTFDFAVYQRIALADHLLELLEVPAGSWVAVGAAAAAIHGACSPSVSAHWAVATGESGRAPSGCYGFCLLGILLCAIVVSDPHLILIMILA